MILSRVERCGIDTGANPADPVQRPYRRHLIPTVLEPLPTAACVCPGLAPGSRPCHADATQEDLLCDACRDDCFVVRVTGATIQTSIGTFSNTEPPSTFIMRPTTSPPDLYGQAT